MTVAPPGGLDPASWREAARPTDQLHVFAQEYSAYCGQGGPLPQRLTPFFRLKLVLEKGRADQLGVTQKVEFIDRPIPPDKRGVWHIDGGGSSQDGPYKYDFLFATRLLVRQTWYQGKRKLRRYNNRGTHYFALAGTTNGDAEYPCPNCGAINTTETLIAGCAHCGTKFQLSDFAERMAAFGKATQARWFGENQFMQYMGVFLLVAYTIIACFSFPATYKLIRAWATGTVDQLFSPLPIMVVGGPFLTFACLYCFIGLSYSGSRAFARRWFAKRARAIDPAFSLEAMHQSLDNKLAAVHYATSPQQIETFVNCDLSAHLAGYADVAECQIRNVRFGRFTRAGEWYLATMKVKLRLTRLRRRRKRRQTVRVRLTLQKKVSAAWFADPIAYQCASCGGTVNLEQYGVCQHCGTPLELENYDWVMATYAAR
ncbi:MAG: hypothetical protein LBR19_06325 [Bifidobacteriaceae bacterium]|nr:hypothetical protein [Bifidobacteriaceae bacterium]